MNREEAKKIVLKIFDYIENGEEKTEYDTFIGHPGLFFFRSKDEFNILLEELLNKDTYDRYDIYYICQRLIKYLLDKYDSHTKLYFKNDTCFSIEFIIQNDKVFVTNISGNYSDIIGGKLVSINGIPIEEILKELEQIVCYSTKEYLNTMIANYLSHINILKSLPIMNNNIDSVEYMLLSNGKERKIIFHENVKYDFYKDNIPDNYTYDVIDDILVMHYNACKDKDKMIKFIEKIKLESLNNDIKYYIVDIRNNRGGDSSVIYPLIEFLKNKKVVTLINENVFSSGRMALIELKKIGSYIIGTNICTSLNAFGNVPGEYFIDELGLKVKKSSTYWYYDANLNCKGFRKGEFEEYFKDNKNLLEPIIFEPDQYVYMTIDDTINNNDSQLNAAIEYIKNRSSIKK